MQVVSQIVFSNSPPPSLGMAFLLVVCFLATTLFALNWSNCWCTNGITAGCFMANRTARFSLSSKTSWKMEKLCPSSMACTGKSVFVAVMSISQFGGDSCTVKDQETTICFTAPLSKEIWQVYDTSTWFSCGFVAKPSQRKRFSADLTRSANKCQPFRSTYKC